jgi:hypothetical protein
LIGFANGDVLCVSTVMDCCRVRVVSGLMLFLF